MDRKDIVEQALLLKPAERYWVVECLLKSLDKPDSEIDALWAEEAEKRLVAYRAGKIEGIPFEEIFAEER